MFVTTCAYDQQMPLCHVAPFRNSIGQVKNNRLTFFRAIDGTEELYTADLLAGFGYIAFR